MGKEKRRSFLQFFFSFSFTCKLQVRLWPRHTCSSCMMAYGSDDTSRLVTSFRAKVNQNLQKKAPVAQGHFAAKLLANGTFGEFSNSRICRYYFDQGWLDWRKRDCLVIANVPAFVRSSSVHCKHFQKLVWVVFSLIISLRRGLFNSERIFWESVLLMSFC